jgi:hypothetical protein
VSNVILFGRSIMKSILVLVKDTFSFLYTCNHIFDHHVNVNHTFLISYADDIFSLLAQSLGELQKLMSVNCIGSIYALF